MGTRRGRIPCRNTLFKDPRPERCGKRSFHVPAGLGLPDIILELQVGQAGKSQTKMVDLHGLLWQEVWEVGRTARNPDKGKPPTPQPWKFPYRGFQSNTLVLEQISCWAMNP